MGCMLKTLHPVFFYRKVFFPPSKAITPLREDIQKTLFTDNRQGGTYIILIQLINIMEREVTICFIIRLQTLLTWQCTI